MLFVKKDLKIYIFYFRKGDLQCIKALKQNSFFQIKVYVDLSCYKFGVVKGLTINNTAI